MNALAISLSLLWVLAFVAWREWLSYKRPTNGYQAALDAVNAKVGELSEQLSILEMKTGFKRIGG